MQVTQAWHPGSGLGSKHQFSCIFCSRLSFGHEGGLPYPLPCELEPLPQWSAEELENCRPSCAGLLWWASNTRDYSGLTSLKKGQVCKREKPSPHHNGSSEHLTEKFRLLCIRPFLDYQRDQSLSLSLKNTLCRGDDTIQVLLSTSAWVKGKEMFSGLDRDRERFPSTIYSIPFVCIAWPTIKKRSG